MKFGSENITPITPTFQFSPVNLTTLGATEYTLVGIAADRSGSVSAFSREEERALKEIISACLKSPRADNLLIRMTRFDHHLDEVHGFKQLVDCNPVDYDGVLDARGSTALFDATVNAIDAAAAQGKMLIDDDFSANAIIFIITDGDDNVSKSTPLEVKKAIGRATQSECLESLVTILIGVNVQDQTLSRILTDFSKTAGFTQYVELGNANAATLAKLADFVSRSISSQSQSLGTGGPSQALTF